MSLAKLTLRPPPNIDFVQGYPGIPPGGADRPQAAVKGAIEVRVGGQGVKAKWVRIELKKVEVLPGGATFYDYVGQSPINVWQASEEYGMLHTQDFPFYIRIPESIPPSIALEKGAGIRYELIAAVCLKGKRGLLRRDKPTISTVSSTIIIDKHELHSTWPIYQQPETRSQKEGDITLFVERARTCFGPGDRITLSAIVKAENNFKDTLRGFELTLRETTVFRGGPHTTGKKGAPVIKVVHISEQRVPLNAALFGGMQHKADLFVTVPAQHTSATLNTARHIDITYHLVVKALMATTSHVSLDLPVVISNWPKAVSHEAMRRIGLAPNVSIPGATLSSSTTSTSSSPPLIGQPIVKNLARPDTGKSSNSQVDIVIGRPSVSQYNTAPAERSNGNAASKPDEFGVRTEQESTVSSQERSEPYATQTIGGMPGLAGSSSGSGPGRIAPYANETTAFPRPRAASTRATSQRLTITNLNETELAEHRAAERANAANSRAQGGGTAAAAAGPSTAPNQNASRSRWIPAEEEKRLLYETAVKNVEIVQGVRPLSPVNSVQQSSAPSTPPPDSVSMPVSAPATQGPAPKSRTWQTAEEEKARLFETAQAAVARAHRLEGSYTSSPPTSLHGRSDSVNSRSPKSSPQVRAQEPTAGPAPRTPPPAQGGSSGAYRHPSPQTPPSAQSNHSRMPTYMSAEEEKAAMRRFYEAKAAVDRTQETAFGVSPSTPASGPTPYDTLYPSIPASSPQPADGSPPPFAPSSSQPSYLSEKERLRREYEARDAAAMATQPPVPPPHSMAPPMSAVGAPAYQASAPVAAPSAMLAASAVVSSAAAEKEMLRRKFEVQDASRGISNGSPTPPPRSGSFNAGSRAMPTPPRSPFQPPVNGLGSRPLTAAEEKARLKAVYETEDRMQQPPNGMASSPPIPSATPPLVNGAMQFIAPPAPPPLAPKPPKEYIQETQEEDMRTHARLQAIDKEISAVAPRKTELILSSFSADLVDSNGNPIPPPGPPPLLAQPTNAPITIE